MDPTSIERQTIERDIRAQYLKFRMMEDSTVL